MKSANRVLLGKKNEARVRDAMLNCTAVAYALKHCDPTSAEFFLHIHGDPVKTRRR